MLQKKIKGDGALARQRKDDKKPGAIAGELSPEEQARSLWAPKAPAKKAPVKKSPAKKAPTPKAPAKKVAANSSVAPSAQKATTTKSPKAPKPVKAPVKKPKAK